MANENQDTCPIIDTNTCIKENLNTYNELCRYSKDTIVVRDGSIYVSLKDCNIAPLEDRTSWGKLNIKDITYGLDIHDNSPIGSILTVPKKSNKLGYIDYKIGTKFNQYLYPKLYELFGSNVFPDYQQSDSKGDVLPLGSILTTLSETNLPSGWVVWETRTNNLENTDLLEVIKKIAREVTDESSKLLWETAVTNKTFPRVPADVFLRAIMTGSSEVVGNYHKDNALPFKASFILPPIVQTTDNVVLNSIGCSCNDSGIPTDPSDKQFESVFKKLNTTVSKEDNLSCVNLYGTVVDKTKVNTVSGNYTKPYLVTINSPVEFSGSEFTPKHLMVKLIVKVNGGNTASASGEFKQIIKAFTSVDIPVDEATLSIGDALNKFNELSEKLETRQDTLDSNHNQLKNRYDSFVQDYNTRNLEGKLGQGLQGKGTLTDKLKLKINSNDFEFDNDGSLRLATKKTLEILNLNRGNPVLGLSSFHGVIDTNTNKFVVGVPREFNEQNASVKAANVISDLVGTQSYDFVGYQLASNVEVVQYLIDNGKTYTRSNDLGMDSNGTIRNESSWSDWVKTSDTQIPFTLINSHTQSIADMQRTINANKEELKKQLYTLKQEVTNGNTTLTNKVNLIEPKVTTLETKNSTLENKVSTLENQYTTLNQQTSTLNTELQSLKSKVQELTTKQNETCKVPIKSVSSNYTLVDSDNTILCTNTSPITITLGLLPVGRMFTIIQTTEHKVTLAAGSGITVTRPKDGSLVLGGKDSVVTVLVTGSSQYRIFGQTE